MAQDGDDNIKDPEEVNEEADVNPEEVVDEPEDDIPSTNVDPTSAPNNEDPDGA